jgi:hypothetical protein
LIGLYYRRVVLFLVLFSVLNYRVGLYVENDPTTRRFPRIPWYPDHFLHASL